MSARWADGCHPARGLPLPPVPGTVPACMVRSRRLESTRDERKDRPRTSGVASSTERKCPNGESPSIHTCCPSLLGQPFLEYLPVIYPPPVDAGGTRATRKAGGHHPPAPCRVPSVYWSGREEPWTPRGRQATGAASSRRGPRDGFERGSRGSIGSSPPCSLKLLVACACFASGEGWTRRWRWDGWSWTHSSTVAWMSSAPEGRRTPSPNQRLR